MNTRRRLWAVALSLLTLATPAAAQVASVAPVPQQQWTDNSGNPLNAGKIYTYVAGTTTPLATCADQYVTAGNCTTPNANPTILDSAGRKPMYLLPGNTYKFIVKTSADVTIYTQDVVHAGGLFYTPWSGHLLFSPDNTYDIGNTSTFRPRDLNLARSLFVASTSTFSGDVTISGSSLTFATDNTPLTGPSLALNANIFRSAGGTAGHDWVKQDYSAQLASLDNSGNFSLLATGSQFSNAGAVINTGVIQPTALSANTNDWNPTGLAGAYVIRMAATAAWNLTGIQWQIGREILLLNRSAFNITLKDHTGSAGANQFQTAAAADVVIRPGGGVRIYYSSGDSAWGVLAP